VLSKKHQGETTRGKTHATTTKNLRLVCDGAAAGFRRAPEAQKLGVRGGEIFEEGVLVVAVQVAFEKSKL
jgi:hypothetical protein